MSESRSPDSLSRWVRRQRGEVLSLLTASAVARRALRRGQARIDQTVCQATRGRHTLTSIMTGLPTAFVHTIGARTGLVRTATLLVVPYRGGFLAIGSNYGSQRDPAWAHNLRAHPEVDTVVRGYEARVVARELHGDEREAAFAAAVHAYPGWRRYETIAAPRIVPVFQLTALSTGPPSRPK